MGHGWGRSAPGPDVSGDAGEEFRDSDPGPFTRMRRLAGRAEAGGLNAGALEVFPGTDDELAGEATRDCGEVLVAGDPSEVLIRASQGAELLVVGSRGRGGFARAMLGPVSQRRARHAACPVVVVRQDQDPAH
ncbi:hypothetical protein GCM10020295_78510 [Streptomyces cinereospinus]